ncbi:MAG TPA: hypothetical protein VIF62_05075 [Labilithrix sp.]|jgi:hypothetical protein
MARKCWKTGLAVLLALAPATAHADDATVTVGNPPQQGARTFADPPQGKPILVEDDDNRPRRLDDFGRPELRRSPFRLTLGPMGVTTGKSLGVGVGLGADFGTGSVGGRIAASWLRGEGKNADGTSTPTGDMISHYGGELTLDFHKRGPLHPILGAGVGVIRVSRPDTSGWAADGTGRLALEYALGLEDADVRVGASVTGGLVGPVDSDIKDLRGYAMFGAHLAVGF